MLSLTAVNGQAAPAPDKLQIEAFLLFAEGLKDAPEASDDRVAALAILEGSDGLELLEVKDFGATRPRLQLVPGHEGECLHAASHHLAHAASERAELLSAFIGAGLEDQIDEVVHVALRDSLELPVGAQLNLVAVGEHGGEGLVDAGVELLVAEEAAVLAQVGEHLARVAVDAVQVLNRHRVLARDLLPEERSHVERHRRLGEQVECQEAAQVAKQLEIGWAARSRVQDEALAIVAVVVLVIGRPGKQGQHLRTHQLLGDVDKHVSEEAARVDSALAEELDLEALVVYPEQLEVAQVVVAFLLQVRDDLPKDSERACLVEAAALGKHQRLAPADRYLVLRVARRLAQLDLEVLLDDFVHELRHHKQAALLQQVRDGVLSLNVFHREQARQTKPVL